MTGQETSFKVAPALIAASVERRGKYSAIGEEMRELKRWIDSKGIEQSGHPFCLYYDNPSEIPENKLRSEACIPVAASFNPEGRFQIKKFPEARVAETRHRGDPAKFAETYGPFLEELIKSGYRLDGPAREYYMSVSDVAGPGAGFLIQQPVAKE